MIVQNHILFIHLKVIFNNIPQYNFEFCVETSHWQAANYRLVLNTHICWYQQMVWCKFQPNPS